MSYKSDSYMRESTLRRKQKRKQSDSRLVEDRLATSPSVRTAKVDIRIKNLTRRSVQRGDKGKSTKV